MFIFNHIYTGIFSNFVLTQLHEMFWVPNKFETLCLFCFLYLEIQRPKISSEKFISKENCLTFFLLTQYFPQTYFVLEDFYMRFQFIPQVTHICWKISWEKL